MKRLTHTRHSRLQALGLAIALILAPWAGGCASAEVSGGTGGAGGTAGEGGGRPTSTGGGTSSGSGGGTSSGSGGGKSNSTGGGTSTSAGGGTSTGTGGGTSSGSGGSTGTASYALNPPDPCTNQFWVEGCQSGVSSSTCGGHCAVANACSPPEDSSKANLTKTFACPRFMLFSDEMKQAAADDAAANGWGTPGEPAFNYGVVGHDADGAGLDQGGGSSTCCQCYQLVFEKPEPGSAQPPDLPIPKPMIVQSFNTAAGGGKNFDLFMGAGGFGAFNACVSGSYSGTQTTTFGQFQYSAFPSEFNGQGGIKFLNLDECKANGASTVAALTSGACQSRIGLLCDAASATSSAVTATTRSSCKQSNLLASAYHQNWTVRAKKVECPTALTRVTGCRLAAAGLPQPDPQAKTVGAADSTFLSGFTTTTMQDCCKPTCAWKNYTAGAGLVPSGPWTSFYSCDQNGGPITSATP